MKKRIFVFVGLIALLLVIPVQADETIYDETLNISALNYRSVSGNFDSGTDLIITVQVVSGNDISFYILDANNYYNWKAGRGGSAEIIKYDIVSAEIEWEVPQDDTYYFILDNSDSFTSVSVHLTIVQQTGACLGTFLIAVIPIAALVSIFAKKRILA